MHAQPLGKSRLHPCPVNSSQPERFMVMGFKLCQPKWKGMQQTMGEAALQPLAGTGMFFSAMRRAVMVDEWQRWKGAQTLAFHGS